MPTVLRVKGYRIFFFSLESREPPHVHVEQAERYAKVWLERPAVACSRGFRSSELSEILGIVDSYRDLILERWNEHFAR